MTIHYRFGDVDAHGTAVRAWPSADRQRAIVGDDAIWLRRQTI
jgi:hypothetical protein